MGSISFFSFQSWNSKDFATYFALITTDWKARFQPCTLDLFKLFFLNDHGKSPLNHPFGRICVSFSKNLNQIQKFKPIRMGKSSNIQTTQMKKVVPKIESRSDLISKGKPTHLTRKRETWPWGTWTASFHLYDLMTWHHLQPNVTCQQKKKRTDRTAWGVERYGCVLG